MADNVGEPRWARQDGTWTFVGSAPSNLTGTWHDVYVKDEEDLIRVVSGNFDFSTSQWTFAEASWRATQGYLDPTFEVWKCIAELVGLTYKRPLENLPFNNE